MKPSKKKQQKKPGGKIRGNHSSKNGPVLIYVLLFVGVSIVMITLNQVRKKNEQIGYSRENPTSSRSEFIKEGELQFIRSSGGEIVSIDIEIADDDLQTQRGMMYRRSLDQNHGMLFIFPDEEERSFWMKNTYIALDIIYLDANKQIVSISENAPPRSEQSLWSEQPAKYVVEVNAGFVAMHRIAVGDKISFKRTY